MYESQRSSLSNSFNIELETDISVITLDDGINHTYCSRVKWEADNFFPMGVAQLKMPYSEDIESYWIKYSGPVVIHANLNSHPNQIIASQLELPEKKSLNLRKFEESLTEDDEIELAQKTKNLRLKNDEYNYSFIGKTARFKQVGKTFFVYLEDLGWKFLQKVPKEFRDAYISGQRLDDAFQAICEFMGVDFAYSIEDLAEYNFAADGYSIEKDGKVIEDVPSLLREWGKGKEEDEDEELTEEEEEGTELVNASSSSGAENAGLHEYENKKKNEKKKNEKKNTQSNSSLNSEVTNSDEENDGAENAEDTEEDEEKSSESDVKEKMAKYQEEFDEKIKDLFIGNTYYSSNISDPVLNYDWITIEPKATSSTDGATGGGATGGGATGEGGSDESSNENSSSSSKTNTPVRVTGVNAASIVQPRLTRTNTKTTARAPSFGSSVTKTIQKAVFNIGKVINMPKNFR